MKKYEKKFVLIHNEKHPPCVFNFRDFFVVHSIAFLFCTEVLQASFWKKKLVNKGNNFTRPSHGKCQYTTLITRRLRFILPLKNILGTGDVAQY